MSPFIVMTSIANLPSPLFWASAVKIHFRWASMGTFGTADLVSSLRAGDPDSIASCASALFVVNQLRNDIRRVCRWLGALKSRVESFLQG